MRAKDVSLCPYLCVCHTNITVHQNGESPLIGWIITAFRRDRVCANFLSKTKNQEGLDSWQFEEVRLTFLITPVLINQGIQQPRSGTFLEPRSHNWVIIMLEPKMVTVTVFAARLSWPFMIHTGTESVLQDVGSLQAIETPRQLERSLPFASDDITIPA